MFAVHIKNPFANTVTLVWSSSQQHCHHSHRQKDSIALCSMKGRSLTFDGSTVTLKWCSSPSLAPAASASSLYCAKTRISFHLFYRIKKKQHWWAAGKNAKKNQPYKVWMWSDVGISILCCMCVLCTCPTSTYNSLQLTNWIGARDSVLGVSQVKIFPLEINLCVYSDTCAGSWWWGERAMAFIYNFIGL